MVVQRITYCSKKKIGIFFFQKKRKKKSFVFKIQFSWTTSWPDPLWKRYVSSLSKARSQSPKQPWETNSKQCDKIVRVHVSLSPFVLHQASLNFGCWPIYIVCGYVLLAWKHVFVWGINPFFFFFFSFLFCKLVHIRGIGQKVFHDNLFLTS